MRNESGVSDCVFFCVLVLSAPQTTWFTTDTHLHFYSQLLGQRRRTLAAKSSLNLATAEVRHYAI